MIWSNSWQLVTGDTRKEWEMMVINILDLSSKAFKWCLFMVSCKMLTMTLFLGLGGSSVQDN